MKRAALFAAVLAIPATAHASRPYPRFCADELVPPGLEGTFFTSAGIALAREGARTAYPAVLGIGVELTMPAFRWSGFPSGYSSHRSELRYGGWAMGGARLYGGLLEGGAIADVSSPYHASWGTFTARIGAGYGAFPDVRHPHGTVTLLYGVRSVLAHYTRCPPGALPDASVARVFGTYRRALDRGEAWEMVLGIELSPTFFLPPITWWRLAGGPPR